MSIFAPFPENMIGTVPTLCPKCDWKQDREDLSTEQKQFLIDATSYHESLTEFYHLQTLDSLLIQFPGTRNPLVTSKIRKRTRPVNGCVDETALMNLIESTKGLKDFLERGYFDLDGRLPFVCGLVQRCQDEIATLLVTCPNCPYQFAILPIDYYKGIG